jgi:hypothetical protein
MTPHHMTGGYDCFRTAIACLLDIEPATVPDYIGDQRLDMKPSERWECMRNWLRSTLECDIWLTAYPSEYPLESVLNAVGSVNPGMYYVVGGTGAYDDHVVIALDNKVVHDPSRIPLGLTRASDNGFWMVMVLVNAKHRKKEPLQ